MPLASKNTKQGHCLDDAPAVAVGEVQCSLKLGRQARHHTAAAVSTASGTTAAAAAGISRCSRVGIAGTARLLWEQLLGRHGGHLVGLLGCRCCCGCVSLLLLLLVLLLRDGWCEWPRCWCDLIRCDLRLLLGGCDRVLRWVLEVEPCCWGLFGLRLSHLQLVDRDWHSVLLLLLLLVLLLAPRWGCDIAAGVM